MKRDLEAYKLSGSIIAPLSEDVADKIGELSARYEARIRPDVIIVATGLAYNATAVVTRDLQHFSIFKREIEVTEPENVLAKKKFH